MCKVLSIKANQDAVRVIDRAREIAQNRRRYSRSFVANLNFCLCVQNVYKANDWNLLSRLKRV